MNITLNKKSWHYWLATIGDNYVPDTTDICTYVRAMLGNALMCVFAGLGIAIMAFGAIGGLVLMGSFWAWVGWCLYTGVVQPPWELSLMGGFVQAFVLTMLLCWKKKERVAFKHDVQISVPTPPFVLMVWRSIKDKTCTRIHFK